MQLADILCWVVLTITVTACVAVEEQDTEIEETPDGKRIISKREATLILEDYPLDRIFQKPKVIYRRISKQRYGPPKSKYGPPKPKYWPPKASRKPSKKMRKGNPKATPPKYGTQKSTNKHRTNLNRKRASIPKSGKVRLNNKPVFGHILKLPHYSIFAPDKPSFGEPPVAHANDYQDQKQSYGEPPVDSYGAPLKTSISDIYSTPQSFQETSQHYDNRGHNRHEYQWTKHTPPPDSNYAFSKKKPSYTDNKIFVTPIPKDYTEDATELDAANKQVMQDTKFFFRKKRPFYFADSKLLNKPWKPNKQDDFDDEIIVGGQYAEPPGRYVTKLPHQSPMYDDNEEEEDSFTAQHGYVDVDMALSANNSPYSNYKHSNMAFSPQNLNDAFSIVD
ncbi:uncharacterized protein LOC111348979 [Spodoptera litura]|uniref:Uncharacterized protein LOC111348979 n=1 Tax=Spodoptera litura TaxID=69820 RepID=A0A9J7DNW9_SPOLT|nr:uncharacterized protein LOC111348979 [Spodoptera litura]